MNNIDRIRKLIETLIENNESEFFKNGGDIIVPDNDGNIHILFDSGDIDVKISFSESKIREYVD